MNELPAIVQILVAVGGLAGIGTGARELYDVVAKRRAAGVERSQLAIAADAAVDKRWQMLIEAQTKVLLEPLQAQLEGQGETLARQERRITSQDQRIVELENKLDTLGRKYRLALGALRSVYAWIHEHMPGSHPPRVPQELAQEI